MALDKYVTPFLNIYARNIAKLVKQKTDQLFAKKMQNINVWEKKRFMSLDRAKIFVES